MRARTDGVSLDPICGKPVVEQDSASSEYKRRRYFFCSKRCKERFERRAERLRLQDLARMGALFSKAQVQWGVA
ncbi:YHS domain-containing protein [Anaeromyxobacter paludicola]|uniref:TRASH domain-containing protein n=1 Tax=Anaeromyxobacter paludicola TaxID=2918171 RepID=A0ABN6N1Y8_9BACT|nr:YHS domain-containing protein [Anaeromyxobacter paludicola]BDG07071.1 hypothetical protein AMPC_01840 [Anaeromyxobacter paludicola]